MFKLNTHIPLVNNSPDYYMIHQSRQWTSTKFLIVIATIAFFGFAIDEAYAAHSISTFVADDPDNGDIVYSVGDTLTLSFSAPTNQSGTATKANIDGNFTFALPDISAGSTYTGVWADPSTLVITITATGASPTIGVSTAIPSAGTNIGDAGSTHAIGGGAVALTGDFGIESVGGSGGGSCTNCHAPTLGVNQHGKRLVDEGFSYNGKAVDVELFYTPYPLVTAFINQDNVAKFTIFDDMGPQNIRHFSLAFGLSNGEILSESKAVIEWDRSWNGVETVTEFDPENVLKDISVNSYESSCRTESVLSNDCLVLEFHHKFRKPLDFDMIGTNVWDSKRNSWQNYYNHGIKVAGGSLDPAPQHVGLYQGHLVTLTETGKNTAIDVDGNTWTYSKSWTRDFIPQGKIVDGTTMQGIDRNNAWFNTYMKGQELLAQQTLNEMLGGKLGYYDSLNDPITIDYNPIKRTEDFELQQNLAFENYKAYQIFKQITDVKRNH